MKKPLKSVVTPDIQDSMYVSFAGRQHANGMKEYSKAINEMDGVQHHNKIAVGSRQYDFADLLPGISSRPGLSRDDYSKFRPQESIPKDIKKIMYLVNESYKKIGLLRNVIDLMGDFASQGINIVHRDKRKEKFYRAWFEQVHGKERSERFLNNFYRLGTVIIRRMTTKIGVFDETRLQNSLAAVDKVISNPKIEKKVIPWQYAFINPMTVEPIGGPVGCFVGCPVYALTLPAELRTAIKNNKFNDEDFPELAEMFKEIPEEIKKAAKTNKPIALDKEKTLAFFYKKDDWEPFGNIMMESILADIILLNKLKLADIAALDGAISKIRIFKLGSLEHKIAPGPGVSAKLQSILEANVGVGSMDLIWGPDIELIETETDVHQFLGPEKYEPTLKNIYDGLGIPPTLTSTFGSSGTTNNFISLKTLTQRLQYGRDVLISFWNEELKIIQRALGHRFPATVEFDGMNLTDEESQKRLLLQMADRNLISEELLQRKFGHNPDMEKVRLRREKRERESGVMIPKAGPFHDPQFDHELKKIALTSGVATPSEVGLELKECKEGEKCALEMQAEQKLAGGLPTKTKPATPRGRPGGSKDKTKRKPKKFSPVSKGTLEIWTESTQQYIADKLTPMLLSIYGKKNMRQLTNQEAEEAEIIKFDVLWQITPMQSVDENVIANVLNQPITDKKVYEVYKRFCTQISANLGRPLVLAEQRRIQSLIYIKKHADE